jgi:Family of unknown function (DUF5990)
LKKSSTDVVRSLALRITVVEPPPDIVWALQIRQEQVVKPSSASAKRISFDFAVEIVEDDSGSGFRLEGPAVQGRPGGRFVYLRMGAYAGQPGIGVGWRAKISLEGITRKLIADVADRPAAVLAVEFAGTAPKGGPACATVPLLGEGWHVA